MLPSSTSSSDSDRSLPIPRDWWASIAIALAIVAGAEVAARVSMGLVGDRVWAYWHDAAAPIFEGYRSLVATGDVPAVLVVGDSVGARNFDPVRFEAACPGADAWSVAIPGNFPMAWYATVTPLVREGPAPRVVLVIAEPLMFADSDAARRTEAYIHRSVIARRERGALVLGDYLNLASVYRARTWIARRLRSDEPLIVPPAGQGFQPIEGERIFSVRGAGADGPVGDGAAWSLAPERMRVLERLGALGAARGFEVKVVIPPNREGRDGPTTKAYAEWLRTAGRAAGLGIVDMRALDGLSPADFADDSHMRTSGAHKLSAALGDLCANQWALRRPVGRIARRGAARQVEL